MPLNRRRFLQTASAAFAAGALNTKLHAAEPSAADVCVYGATASGVAAAIGAADAGAKVVVIEPSRWLGGMSGGGLNAIDWGYKRAVGRTA
ncbi:MAG: FAD-dependent oxidoreductase, partial [Opitutales bacterium]